MAISVATPTSPTTTLSSSSTAPQTRTSYLRRCIEDLSPDRVASCEKKSSQWNIISIVSTVAFFALAIGAFIATNIFALAYVPIAGISAILFALPAAQQVKKFQEWSQAAKDEAEKYKVIQRDYADLTSRTPQELQLILRQMGIAWNHIPEMAQHPENLSLLNPLLAQAKYLEKQVEYWMNLRDKHANEARQPPTITDSANNEKATARQLALQCEDEALHFKIRTAFVNAVLRKPDFCGTLEDVGTFSKNNYIDRAFGSALNDSTVNQIFTFNRQDLAPITLNDAKTLSIAHLGQRIFTAMAA